MSLIDPVTPYRLCFAYQLPQLDRLKRLAVVKPRENDIFISYAVQDGDFVRRLDKAIREQGLDPWIDYDDIPGFVHFLNDDSGQINDYEKHIRNGILGADVFIFVLSHASVTSKQLLRRLELAKRLNKLIIFLGDVPSVQYWAQLSDTLDDLNYLELFDKRISKVCKRVAHNIIHLQTYIRLLARAIEWDKQGRPEHYLLTVEDLKEVKKQKRWIETHKLGEQFQFTEIQKIFLKTVDRVHETSEYFRKSPPDIFISYARNNHRFVEKLSRLLRENRWKIWLDRDRIPVAANWRAEAEEGVRYAHTVIFVVCPDALRSKNCQWELDQARKYNKRIIPVISDNNYDRNVLKDLGLSGVQYVSFVRAGQPFKLSLDLLLDALRVHLEDLKVYRQLLVKSYEWAECERVDRLLMNRYEYREIQKWHQKRNGLEKGDNRELEPLLPRQKEYIQASQRYLALQRKRQSLAASALVGSFCGLSFLLLSTTFSEIRALVRSLEDLKGLDALVTGLHAGQRVQRYSFFVNALRPGLHAKATTALHRTALKLREINRFERHDGKVFSVKFSPDARQLVSVGDDKSVRFWQLESSETEIAVETCNLDNQQLPGFHSAPVRTLAYSSDQRYVATGDTDGAVKLWTCDGKLYKTLSKKHQFRDERGRLRDARVNRVQFSPGSQYLASAGADGTIFVWSRDSRLSSGVNGANEFRDLIQLDHGEELASVTTLVFSPNGQYLASADMLGRVYLWEINHAYREAPSIDLVRVFQYDGDAQSRSLTAVLFNSDSTLLAFAGVDGAVQVQDLAQSTGRLLVGHDAIVSSIVFSEDGLTLASASFDATVKLWRPRSQPGEELLHTLRGHQGPVYRLAFGPHDDVLATGGADGIVRLWLRDEGIQIEAFEGHKDEISSLAFAPKPSLGYATVLASSSDDGSIRLWDIESPIQPLPHNSDVFDVSFRADGRLIASSGTHNIRIWRQDGTSKSDIEFDEESRVWAVDYSPDSAGTMLAAGGSNGQIKLWKPDINSQEPFLLLDAHSAGVQSSDNRNQGVLDLSFSHNGQWLASVGTDRTLKLWRVEGDRIYRYMTLNHANDVTAVAFSQNDRFLVTSTRARNTSILRGLSIWTMPPDGGRSGMQLKLQRQTEAKHAGSVLALAIQPGDNGLIASGGEDGIVHLWHASGKWRKALKGHTDPVTAVSFSADGQFLASSSEDGAVRLWTAKGDLISVLERHKRAVSSVEFGPKGSSLLASSSIDEDVLIWELWDAANIQPSTRNQNKAILAMLVADSCETVLPFLNTHYPADARSQGNISGNVDQVLLREIKNLKDFCGGPSIFPRPRR